jgi:transposase
MKTVIKINPELEYENAKKIIEQAALARLDIDSSKSLDSSVDKLVTVARVLMEREERRRGNKTPPKKEALAEKQKKQNRDDFKKLPSERYPELEINETILRPIHPPCCPCCGVEMKESGLFDVSENLEIIPKRYFIEREKRVKYNCTKCHGGMVNTPAKPSITPTSNYSDNFIIDVALSKYCDLIPIERYVAIAARQGLVGLPPQSLIGLTHHLADFLTPVVDKIKKEVLSANVLLSDETEHKMLEGDPVINWRMWGFFSSQACYYELHNTRSGNVVIEFLKSSSARFLVSDGFSGYARAIKETNKMFARNIVVVFCNAHAYRYFKEAGITWKDEAEFFLKKYGDIYELERQSFSLTPEERFSFRKKMVPLFEDLKEKCKSMQAASMPGSGLLRAINYFLNQYNGLIVCTENIDVPLDNNLSERNLRSPVVGRKTWYGTHSRRGALTNAILFSCVQSCKLININPRHYFPWIVERIHKNEEILTPFEYLKIKETQ